MLLKAQILSSKYNHRIERATRLCGAAPSQCRARGFSVNVQAVADIPTFRLVGDREAILCQKFQAHEATVSSLLVLEDTEENKQILTGSLDKTLALWVSHGSCNELCSDGYTNTVRLTPPGGPIFSMLADKRAQDGLPTQVFMGNHAKQVIDWCPPRTELEAAVVLDNHCGWVRSLASAGSKWLFSAACNQLNQWDMARAVPRAVSTITLDKGDILALAASKERVYTAGADGSIRAFDIGKKGELTAGPEELKAHNDRVTALALTDSLLFTASYDGSLKAWDASTLELALHLPAAHDGERIYCLAIGPDGLLYSGADDKLVRRWWPEVLLEAATPLYCHNSSIRALAAGSGEIVVSADKGGEVAVWKVCT